MTVTTKQTPKPPCPRCGRELGLSSGKKPYFFCSHCGWEGKKLKTYRFFGAISNNVTSVVTYKGKELTDPHMPCPKCGGEIDLDNQIDLEGGKSLAVVVIGMQDYAKLLTERNELHEKRDKTNLYDYWRLLDINARKIERLEANGMNRSSHTQDVKIACPHCYVPLGYVTINLKLTVPDVEVKRLTWEESYANLGNLPKEIAALVAHKLGFQSWDALKRYTDNPDLPKLMEMVEQFKSKFSELNIDSDLTYKFATQLDSLVSELPKMIRERKHRVVEEIIDLAEVDAATHAR